MEGILTREEIENENIRMRLEEDTLLLLKQYPKMINRKQLLELFRTDFIPSQASKEILENRNIKNIPNETIIESGITITRTTLKYLPTEKKFYSSNIVEENTATVLPFATPLLILYQSLDKDWYYVQCSFYRGWISKKEVVMIKEQERLNFEESDKFIIITEPLTPYYNTLLDLGIKLPILGIHEDSYEVFIPTKEGITISSISREICNLGYLPYTKENICDLAYKCLGIPYKWGGIENGVDCSLLIQTIFKTFGFLFPRDTQSQEKRVGIRKIDLRGKTEVEKKEILKSIQYPAIIHKKGHILLAISDTKIIHAYGDAGKVILSNYECYGTNLYPYLTSISTLFK